MMTTALPVAAALWAVLSSTPPPAHEGGHVFYDLRPYGETHPELQAAWSGRADPTPHRTGLLRAIQDAGTDANAPWSDPHTVRVAHWLLADGLLRTQELEAASRHAQELDVAGSSLIDPLIAPLTDALHAAKRSTEAAQWGFAHIHAGSEMREHAEIAAERFEAVGSPKVALQRVTALLRRTLSVRTRRSLTFLAARLEALLGDKASSIARLQRLWWETTSGDTRRKAAVELKNLGSRPTELEELAKVAFETRAKDAKSVRRRLKRRARKTRNAKGKRIVIWARALIAGIKKDTREESEEVVAKYTKKLRGTDAEPWALVGHAVALRRLNRDVQSAQVYEDMATRFPRHPLAAHALAEAAGLYGRKGFPTESDALYRRVVAMRQHGKAEREALWNVGFSAFLRGDDDAAIQAFSQLVVGYGGERDGLGITWTERAEYWSARAATRQGRVKEAARRYADLQHRFPLGWYALLAAARNDELAGKATGTRRRDASGDGLDLTQLRIARRPVLDHPVALVRLGDEARATERLSALFLTGQLPGSGRSLLAALYRRAGHADKANSLLRRHGVLAEVPGPAQSAVYSASFPYQFGPLLETTATIENVPPALVAGLIFVESRFNPKARSGVGAIGLMQLMPGTARRVSKRMYGKAVSARKLRRPKTNLHIGTTLLRRLLNRFHDHVVPALAAYNAGHGAATSWLRQRGHLPTDAWVETIPYDQTRRYVMRVVSMTEVYRQLYGVRGQALSLPMQLPTTLGPFDGPQGAGSNGAVNPSPESRP